MVETLSALLQEGRTFPPPPDFSNHGASATSSLGTRTPFTAVSQTPVSGSGSSGSPFTVTTVATAGPFQITEVDKYVAGQESYRTDIAVKNNGGANQSLILYRAGDAGGRGFSWS